MITFKSTSIACVLLVLTALAMAQTARAESLSGNDPATAPATRPDSSVASTRPSRVPASRPAADAADLLSGSDEAGDLMAFQDMPVVVAAAKRPQAENQAAASVSVVDANDISLFGYRDIADVLRNQRSFYLGSDGLNTFVGVRGFLRPGEWNARIMLTVDGRSTREDIYSQSHIDEDFVVPIEAIKQVEIVRGPGSALYGSGADFAVINVVTKDGADINGAQLTLQGGTQETGRASLIWGQKFSNGWDVLACFSGYTSQGDRDVIFDGVTDPAHNFGHIRNADYEGADAGFIKARNGDFTIEADLESRNRDNRDATYLTSFADPGAMHEDRHNISVSYDHTEPDGQGLHAMVFASHYLYRQSWPIAADDRYTTFGNDDWMGEEIHYVRQLSPSLHLTVGAEGNQALFTHQHDYTTTIANVVNVSPTYNSWGIFAETEWKAQTWLTLVTGLRLDEVQRIGTHLDPRFAAIISPDKNDTIKILYGRAFRAPNLYEMFYSDPGANTPNPHLQSEIVDTYELAWERRFSQGWHTSLGYYYWEMQDAMEDIPLADGSIQTQNIGHLQAQGVEAEIGKRWSNDAQVRAYATLDQATHGGAQLTHSPQWITGAALDFPIINNRTFISIEPQIVGAQKSDLGQWVQPTYLTNVTFTSRDIRKGLDFQLGVYGLFADHARLPRDNAGDHYQPTLDYPLTRVMASLTYRF